MDESGKDPIQPHAAQFHTEQFVSLHGEIRELNNEARSLERQALFATGAIWAWLAVQGTSFPKFAWYVPVLFALGGLIRALSLKRAIENIAIYIAEIEALFPANSRVPGWQNYRAQKEISSGVMRSATAFWVTLFVLTLIIPTVVWVL